MDDLSIKAPLMNARVPSGYAKFINRLWDRLRHRFEHDFLCTQPLAPTTPNAPEQKTKLHEYYETLTKIGSSVAIRKIARKAWKTPKGRNAIKAITRAALDIPSRVATEPLDLSIIQRRRVRYVRTAIDTLLALIERDHPTVSVLAYADEEWDLPDGEYEELPLSPEPDRPHLPQPALPDEFWYGGALDGVVGTPVSIERVLDLNEAIPGPIVGHLNFYGLERLLTSLAPALASREEELAGRCPETQDDDNAHERRVIFALADALTPFAEAFDTKETGTLRRNALVGAFASVMLGSFADEHAEYLKRVGEVLRRRKSYRKSSGGGPEPALRSKE